MNINTNTITDKWNSCNKKPTENGVYERKYKTAIIYNKWEDGYWYAGDLKPEFAVTSTWLSKAKVQWREIQSVTNPTSV